MSGNAIAESPRTTTIFRPVLIGGTLAGTLDQIAAFISSGFNVPRVVAAGLFGPQIIKTSGPMWWLIGLLLHFFIAYTAAAIYCIASWKLDFLKKHFVICGLFFGMAVFLVGYLVVMPLCAFHYKGPYALATLLQAAIVNMVLIGLPISVARARF